jgi:CII-binding regulator of phage lambda lysogenization HflD
MFAPEVHAEQMTRALAPLQQAVAAVEQMAQDTEAEAKKLLEGVNMDELSDADIAEFFFLVGPEFVSLQIGLLLVSAASAKDLEAITALSDVRHTLFAKFTE